MITSLRAFATGVRELKSFFEGEMITEAANFKEKGLVKKEKEKKKVFHENQFVHAKN